MTIRPEHETLLPGHDPAVQSLTPGPLRTPRSFLCWLLSHRSPDQASLEPLQQVLNATVCVPVKHL